MRLTLAQMRERADYWLERLEMGEWRGRVLVLYKSAGELERLTGVDAAAGCWWSPEECRGEIYIRRGHNTESNLLHEIGHILISGHETPGPATVHVERAINRLVAGLLA